MSEKLSKKTNKQIIFDMLMRTMSSLEDADIRVSSIIQHFLVKDHKNKAEVLSNHIDRAKKSLRSLIEIVSKFG